MKDSKETEAVNLKGDKPWTFTGRTDAEAEAPVFWSSNVNSWLIGKIPDSGKDWGQEEKRASEDEMAGQITDAMNMNLGKFWEMVRDREAWRATVYGIAKSWIQLGDWTTTTTSQQMSFSNDEWYVEQSFSREKKKNTRKYDKIFFRCFEIIYV